MPDWCEKDPGFGWAVRDGAIQVIDEVTASGVDEVATAEDTETAETTEAETAEATTTAKKTTTKRTTTTKSE